MTSTALAPVCESISVVLMIVRSVLLRELADRREHLAAHLLVAGIDQQHAVVADLHGDVAAGAGDHVHLPLHVQGLDLQLRPVGLLRKAASASAVRICCVLRPDGDRTQAATHSGRADAPSCEASVSSCMPQLSASAASGAATASARRRRAAASGGRCRRRRRRGADRGRPERGAGAAALGLSKTATGSVFIRVPVLRIHLLGPAERHFLRQVVRRRILGHPRVLARQVVRHLARARARLPRSIRTARTD